MKNHLPFVKNIAYNREMVNFHPGFVTFDKTSGNVTGDAVRYSLPFGIFMNLTTCRSGQGCFLERPYHKNAFSGGQHPERAVRSSDAEKPE
ncbi:MAG: hypothetical protein E7442_04145 [Ruminococcaceae bacterium]|nr:hypothetical protein [Oscillospiraceae bacterium]